ncbi:hypothetical protein IJH97_00860 [Candidatus Saccharibacteria bacterium]|nr:hypothetical protein [Candidatus Saccharibacteria bacterium]
MQNYFVLREKLISFVRKTLKLKKADGFETGVVYLAELLTIMVEHDFVETALDAKLIVSCHLDGSWSEVNREIRKAVNFAWKNGRVPLFSNLYSMPSTSETLCILAAEMVTKPDLLRKNGFTMESASERTARTRIIDYLHPETVRTPKLLAAYIFMINSCEKKLSWRGYGNFYTDDIKESVSPRVTRKNVESLFNAQMDWWEIEDGEMFGQELPSPTPSEIYYHIQNCMAIDYKKRKR